MSTSIPELLVSRCGVNPSISWTHFPMRAAHQVASHALVPGCEVSIFAVQAILGASHVNVLDGDRMRKPPDRDVFQVAPSLDEICGLSVPAVFANQERTPQFTQRFP